MPPYDFKCTQCDTQFRKSLPFGSQEGGPCPKCHGKTQKMFMPPAMIFKGSGFYKTDSSKTTKPAAKETETKADVTASDAGTPAGTEAKVETSKKNQDAKIPASPAGGQQTKQEPGSK